MFNFFFMGVGAGWGIGVFCHDFATERILHVDHAKFHWTDGKILGPVIGSFLFFLGVAV